MARKKQELNQIEEIITKEIDTKKIMKNLTDELDNKKRELLDDIYNKIDDQIEIRVNKKMKEEEKRILRSKSLKLFRKNILIILLIIIVLYLSYCLYEMDFHNIKTIIENKGVSTVVDTEKEEKDKQEEKYDSSYYIEKYSYLVDRLQINDSSIFDFYKKSYTVNNLTNEIKLKIAYLNLSDNSKNIKNDTIEFSFSDLEESSQELFGNNVSIQKEIFTYNQVRMLNYNDIYLGFIEEGKNNNFVYEIYNAYEDENNLIFEIVIGKVEDNKIINVMTNKTVIDSNSSNLISKKGELSKHKLIFNKEGDKYYFNSVEYIK